MTKDIKPTPAPDLKAREQAMRQRLAPAALATGLPIDEFVDAELLLDFTLANGREVNASIVETITRTRQALETKADKDTVINFRKAYGQLTILMAPVTAATIRNSNISYGRKISLLFKRRSEAGILSLKLWLWTIATLIFILIQEIGSETLMQWYPLDDTIDAGNIISLHIFFGWLGKVTPFAYGLLGSCAYLLRSSHHFAIKRCFDTARIPEYYNRMLLGFVAGGAVLLFVAQVTDDQGQVIRLSGAALGFLAGYHIEFLFQAIERVAEALLPRVGLDSIRRATPKTIVAASVSLEDLINQANSATDPDVKKTILEMIEKIKNKM